MSTAITDERRYARLLDKAVPVVIETAQEYERLLAAIEALMDKDDEEVTAEEGLLLKLLAMLVEDYEDRKIKLRRSKADKARQNPRNRRN